MRTEYYLPEGLVIRHTNDARPNGLFSLTKWFKKMLLRYHIGFVDDCCTPNASPNGTDVTNLPVRYNLTAGHVQYYNPTTKLWTNVPAL